MNDRLLDGPVTTYYRQNSNLTLTLTLDLLNWKLERRAGFSSNARNVGNACKKVRKKVRD